jgi:hypothetical protein
LNLYSYCGNNPVINIDHYGNFFFSIFIAALVAGVIAGGVYGGMTAAANGQSVWAGVGIGALAGGLMGIGVAIAAPLIFTGGFATIAGIAVAFGSGFVVGMGADLATQVVNLKSGEIIGWSNIGSAALTGLQWGILNTINAFTCGLAGDMIEFSANLALGLWANFMYGSIGLLFDIFRGQKSKKININNTQIFYYNAMRRRIYE